MGRFQFKIEREDNQTERSYKIQGIILPPFKFERAMKGPINLELDREALNLAVSQVKLEMIEEILEAKWKET